MSPPRRAVVGLVLFAAACGGPSPTVDAVADLPVTDADALMADLAASAEPAVVNVWASWCVPCRSEAPLLARAADAFSDRVRFIGLNVRDGHDDAKAFIAEFFPDAAIDHVRDEGGTVPVALGGNRGVPLTFFYAPGGELVNVHLGVIDERTLALQIDEIMTRQP